MDDRRRRELFAAMLVGAAAGLAQQLWALFARPRLRPGEHVKVTLVSDPFGVPDTESVWATVRSVGELNPAEKASLERLALDVRHAHLAALEIDNIPVLFRKPTLGDVVLVPVFKLHDTGPWNIMLFVDVPGIPDAMRIVVDTGRVNRAYMYQPIPGRDVEEALNTFVGAMRENSIPVELLTPTSDTMPGTMATSTYPGSEAYVVDVANQVGLALAPLGYVHVIDSIDDGER